MTGGARHRLAAILAADVVGYSRLVAVDETGTLAAMRAHRLELWDPVTEAHGGRLVGTAGDSRLVEFPSAVAAVECAVTIQQAMVQRNEDVPEERSIRLRVGINLGDVVVDGDDILGDGVNIAARLEAEAQPDSVCVSDDVMRQVRGRLDLAFTDGGERKLKNIPHAVRVWHWTPATAARPLAETQMALPDKPSIAVLPFANMSGDPEQEFFADGITEDTITALSRFRSLFVIARSSSFTYKGTSPDVRTVARELGVRYVVEGSVRKAGNRVRITAQLIDAASGNHIWADKFDGDLDSVFEFQDHITEAIVVAIAPEVEAQERDRARRRPPESLDSWSLLHRGLYHSFRINKTDIFDSIKFFRESIKQDPDFAAPHAHLAYALWSTVIFGYAEDVDKVTAEARRTAIRAVSLDPNEPMSYLALGRTHILSGDVQMALVENRKAIELNPNFARGHHGLGFAYYYGAGDAVGALPHFDTALRLSPRDPWRWITLMVKSSALRFLGLYEEAIEHCRLACQLPDSGSLPHMHLSAALIEAGHYEECALARRKALELQPDLSITFVREHFIGMHEDPLISLLESLQKAGFPE